MRARVDGQVYELDDEIRLDRYKIHTIEAVVDRLVIIASTRTKQRSRCVRSRLTDSVETALKFGEGYLTVQDAEQILNRASAICISPSTWPAPSMAQSAGDRAAHLFVQHAARRLPGMPGAGRQAGDRPRSAHPGQGSVR